MNLHAILDLISCDNAITGQFEDFIEQVKIVGLPPQQNYLFLGDYVDR